MTAEHPGQPGTRGCWALGCARYECLIRADIDPVVVDRYMDGVRDKSILTLDEREEVLRRQVESERVRASYAQRRDRAW